MKYCNDKPPTPPPRNCLTLKVKHVDTVQYLQQTGGGAIRSVRITAVYRQSSHRLRHRQTDRGGAK